MNELACAIGRIGCPVTVESREGLKTGKAVFYPLRFDQRQWGGLSRTDEGRQDMKRYQMFCGRELLEGSGYGSRIYAGNESYILIWQDEYEHPSGQYIRACVRKVTEE